MQETIIFILEIVVGALIMLLGFMLRNKKDAISVKSNSMSSENKKRYAQAYGKGIITLGGAAAIMGFIGITGIAPVFFGEIFFIFGLLYAMFIIYMAGKNYKK